jgi:hypothetical protein
MTTIGCHTFHDRAEKHRPTITGDFASFEYSPEALLCGIHNSDHRALPPCDASR